MFTIFKNQEDGALTLINNDNPDFMFYEERLSELFSGTKKECVDFIFEYQDENLIPDEEFIYMEIK